MNFSIIFFSYSQAPGLVINDAHEDKGERQKMWVKDLGNEQIDSTSELSEERFGVCSPLWIEI